MKTFDECLRKVTNNVYNFTVKYTENSKTSEKELIYPTETLEFYHSLSPENEPQIWVNCSSIIEGKRIPASKRLSVQDCERAASDEEVWEKIKFELRYGIAAKIMSDSLFQK